MATKEKTQVETEAKELCPECEWPMVTDEDGTYCERCDSPDNYS